VKSGEVVRARLRNRRMEVMAVSGKPKTVTIYRDAKTGEIVTEKYAKTHPATTEKETRPAPKPRSK